MFGEYGMGYGSIFMWVFWIFWIGVIAWVVTMLTGNSRRSSEKQTTALDILKERYARGEIDQQEFAQKKKDLEES
jgi:putative membrane protein